MSIIKDTLFPTLRSIHHLITAMSFWGMAFVAFLMRLFVTPPLGALLALTIGTVWCLGRVLRK